MSFGGIFGGGGDGYGSIDQQKKTVNPSKALGFMSAISALEGVQDQSANIQQVQDMANWGRSEINEIVKYAEEGDWTWKLLGMFGGLAMIGVGGLTFMGDFFLFNYFGKLKIRCIYIRGICTQ